MRAEAASKRLLAMTRAKAKMNEFVIPEIDHIAIDPRNHPDQLFHLAVAAVGEYAAQIADEVLNREGAREPDLSTVHFATRFFDAYWQSGLGSQLNEDVRTLAAAGYYLAGRPGSSDVVAPRVTRGNDHPLHQLLHWVLCRPWATELSATSETYWNIDRIAFELRSHYETGENLQALFDALKALRDAAYARGSARELLWSDLIAGICVRRTEVSSWSTLPHSTGVDRQSWAAVIASGAVPSELWPAQLELARRGVFSGASAVVQMPTSAGKTRALEILLRAALVSKRARTALVIAPFRALCHEISASLRLAFRGAGIEVSEIPDVLQFDMEGLPGAPTVLVATPEKLLYLLRSDARFVSQADLLVFDEAHQFDSPSRGVTYELLMTEAKALLPAGRQVVLISAVMPNAAAIGRWLVGEDVTVVTGDNLLPTERSIAFASWTRSAGRLEFFDEPVGQEASYFVPRLIEESSVRRGTGEREETFPRKDRPADVALHLGLRAVEHGPVAVFCGRKDTAANIAKRASQVLTGSKTYRSPASTADQNELPKLVNLVEAHFGPNSSITQGARRGVFEHHAAVPNGIRLAVEYAMQRGHIRFVVCTSTLAQGVNLPIRYLIVPSVYQAGDRIPTRDFQNLVGRAGRAGMYTEGTVIFADPSLYDNRASRTEGWKFRTALDLMRPENTEATSSTLLAVLAPFGRGRSQIHVAAQEIVDILFEESLWAEWAANLATANRRARLTPRDIVLELRRRREVLEAVESYLMAHRPEAEVNEVAAYAEQVATGTLAYHLADADTRSALQSLFRGVALVVEGRGLPASTQRKLGRTLLGVARADIVRLWVEEQTGQLAAAETAEDLLRLMWPLFREVVDDTALKAVDVAVAQALAGRWRDGQSYAQLWQAATQANVRLPHGRGTRPISLHQLVDLCENTLGFECGLVISAVAGLLGEKGAQVSEVVKKLLLLQKELRYGLSGHRAVEMYERGLADRVVAQAVAIATEGRATPREYRRAAMGALAVFPAYYRSGFMESV